MNRELTLSAVEINSIFQNMSRDLLNKIPANIKDFFIQIADKNYDFKYDKTLKLNEQKIMPKTKGILALIYRDYICNDLERKNYINECNKILNVQNNNNTSDFSNLFKKNKTTEHNHLEIDFSSLDYTESTMEETKSEHLNKIPKKNMPLIQNENQSIFRRILDMLKNFFRF